MQRHRNVKGMRKVEPLVLGVETKVYVWVGTQTQG